MAEETEKKSLGPKRRLTKPQAISIMVAGGAMLVVPWFFPTQEDSAMYMVKMAIATVGFVALCLGSYYRP